MEVNHAKHTATATDEVRGSGTPRTILRPAGHALSDFGKVGIPAVGQAWWESGECRAIKAHPNQSTGGMVDWHEGGAVQTVLVRIPGLAHNRVRPRFVKPLVVCRKLVTSRGIAPARLE